MTVYVFEFFNVYLPEGTVYENEEYSILIEPVDWIETFEEERREPESEYADGYWHTADCYIEAGEDRVKELAEWLSFIYSFAQKRDVRWTKYYPLNNPEDKKTIPTYEFRVDNTTLPEIKFVHGPDAKPGIGDFVDVALETLDSASGQQQSRIIGGLMLFIKAAGESHWPTRFLFLWMVLESNANDNYYDYLQDYGEPIFTEGEIETIRDSALEEFQDVFDERQLEHLAYVLGQSHIYEASSKTKIKIYLEYLDIGFDIKEVLELIETARGIRNVVAHRNDDERLMNNHDIVVDLRKIVFYVLLRELGVDEQMQQRVFYPNILGPEIEY